MSRGADSSWVFDFRTLCPIEYVMLLLQLRTSVSIGHRQALQNHYRPLHLPRHAFQSRAGVAVSGPTNKDWRGDGGHH